MRRFLILLFAVANIACFAGSRVFAAENYTAEVKIDITAGSAAEAREKGMKQAYRSAFMAVASQTTNEQGLARLEKLTDDQLINFIKETTVISEKASDVRYMATLKITVNKDLLKTFMQEQEINYAVPTSSNILIIPIFREQAGDRPLLWEKENLWRQVWEENAVTNSANTYVSVPYDSTTSVYLDAKRALSLDGLALDKVSRHMGTSNIFVLDAVYDGNEGLKVTILPYKDNLTNTVNITGKKGTELLSLAQPQIVRQIDSMVRREKITADNSPKEIMVLYDCPKLSNWIKAENKIKELNTVDNVTTVATGKGKVQFSLSFIGNIEDLTAALRLKSFRLTELDGFYVLEDVRY